MFRTYCKIAWRTITRHKTFSAINVLGLVLGICSCLIIYLVTSYELSFDKFHPDKERIYRIVGEIRNGSGETDFLNCPIPQVAEFQRQIPGFESGAGFHSYGPNISIPDGSGPPKKFDNRIDGSYQSSVIITWPAYFDIFKYQWLAGNAQALGEPYRVVLSEKRAQKYFGNIPPRKMIGKTVIYDDSLKVSVAGIVKDWDLNTDFGYTDFISISTATHSFLKSWIATEDWASLQPHNGMAFVKLTKSTTAAQVNDRFAQFIKDRVKLPHAGAELTMWLQPLDNIHFTSDLQKGDDGDDFRKPAPLSTLYALMGIALFILIIAVVNFINLSTAQSIRRAKEVGVRKVMGGNKKSIMWQFLTETFVLTVFSVIISALLVRPVLYVFSDYTPAGVVFHPFQISTLAFLLIITVFTTLMAGFYPARVLASYLPVLSLKGANFQKGMERLNLRKTLIVFQFTISLLFIIAAIVIGRQIRFMDKADKGFNSDAVVIINHWRDGGKLKVFADNIRPLAGIGKVIIQANAPMGFAHSDEVFKYKGGDEAGTTASVEQGDEDFIPFYQFRLLAGRNMHHSDSMNELVINETYSRILGFTDPRDAVGKFLYSNDKPHPIVGVVADFHEGSFHEGIRPVVITREPGRDWSVAIKLAGAGKTPGEVKAILSQMEQQWKKIYPEEPFNYNFLNESITWLYGEEEKTAWLVNIAMSITIFISCMGLFGLGLFTAQVKRKEIGIRKVLGASVTNIAAMLSKEFVILVIIALVIASPVAWYFMNQWLLDFAYRIDIGWWVFALAGSAAIFIAILTISFQAIKAAMANPVKSLRTE